MAVEVNKRKRKHAVADPGPDEGSAVVPSKQAKKSKSPKVSKKKDVPVENGNALDDSLKNTYAEEDITDSLQCPEIEESNLDDIDDSQQTLKVQKKKQAKVKNTDTKDDADSQQSLKVEKKKQKKNKKADDIDESQHDSGFASEEKAIRFSKDFKMMEFRTKLRGDSFITELRHFLHLCQARPKTLAKYIEKRGKPLELAEALERIDKNNVLQAAYVCEALQLVLMEILGNQRSHMESAVHASRYFLRSHGPVVELLLKSAQLNHRKIALKLLTAIVCVEPQLGRQVLSSYDVLSNVRTINQFLAHSNFEMQQLVASNDEEYETVRKCFIHFVLSYLVDGNTLLIRNIMDRGSLIGALVYGLQYDDAVTVCVVLNTLKKYVLECPEISKTKKIHVFSIACCRQFALLYDWKGPSVYVKELAKKDTNKRNYESVADPQGKEAVEKAVHEFLLVLLTSRKYGLTFDTIKYFRQKHNVIQGQIIGYLKFPWQNASKTELIVKILETCPDLYRNTVRHYAGVINLLNISPRWWQAGAEFLIRVINTCHPDRLKGALDKITLTDFAFLIKEICLPIETLVHISGSKLLKHKKFEYRLTTNRLLYAMFKQYTNYMQVIMKREQRNKGSNSLRKFKFDILNHLLVHFPTMEDILTSLDTTIGEAAIEGVDVLAHLDVALDLILILCKENRSFVNKTSAILSYLEVLRPLYGGEGEGEDSKGNIQLEMKAIKTVLWISPKDLDPQKKRFSDVLTSFIKAFVYGEPEISREAGVLLRGIFKNTGIFDSGELEIDLWLEALKFMDPSTVTLVGQVFNEVLKVTKAQIEGPKTTETLTNTANLHSLFDNIENGLSVQAYVESLSISKLMPLIFKGVEIEQSLGKYLETVCLLMFHYYPSPDYVMSLYKMHFNALAPYMKNWLSPKVIKEKGLQLDIDQTNHITKFQDIQTLVFNGSLDFEKMFESKSTEEYCEMEFNGNPRKFLTLIQNDRLLMIYAQQVLFQVDRLAAKQLLTEEQAHRSAEFITNCLEMMLKTSSPEEISLTVDVEADPETFISKFMKYIYGARLNTIKSGDLITSSKDNPSFKYYLLFLKRLTEYCNKMEYFDVFAENFKLKLVKAVAISLNFVEEIKANSEQLEEFINLLNVFNLSSNHCVEILDSLLSKITYKDLFSDQQKTIYYTLITCTLQRLAELKRSVKSAEFIKTFSKLYSNLFKKFDADINVDTLEEAFCNFLTVNHQFIGSLNSKFFESFFRERKLSKASIKLCCLLFERNASLNSVFLDQLESNIDKKELIYPLLAIAIAKKLPIDSTLLQKIYQNYKNGFMRCIEKPLKAGVIYKEHVESSIELIEKCMPLTECRDFCNKQIKFENIESYQIRLIYAIYNKAFNNADLHGKSSIFVNFITLKVQMLALDMKMQKLNQEKLQLMAYELQQWFQQGLALSESTAKDEDDKEVAEDHKEFSPDFSKLLKSQQWLQFCKASLKTGMHVNETEIEAEQQDQFNGLLLKLLAYLCEHLYQDYSEELSESEALQEPGQLYEMIFGHSKFYDFILTKIHQCLVKTQIVHLLFTLAKKTPSCLNEKQIPFILGSYQARLSDSDRYALALLNLFEYYDCGLAKYRPFIWGESAVAFYSLRAGDEERAKLTQQETSIQQVMSLVDRQVCEYTIDNFPIWRKLDTLQQLPDVEFENPFVKPWTFGANALERKLELGVTDISEQELRLCPKRKDLFDQCYDPSFFVPLMSMCFAPEAFAHPARPVQNGLLSLIFAALSSQDKDMRLAAGCVQLRYRGHFENSKFFERPLWIQVYENIQSGLNDLRNSWLKHKSNKGTPRVPFISGLFISKTFNLTTDPTHLLYKQLTMYLRLKSSFNFQCIPEFNVLFYSHEVEHHEFRKFIVEIIRNGVKSSSDLFLLVSTNTFKVLMGFYGSTMSTLELNLLILSVFSTCVKIPASTKIMVDHVGIIPWLCSIVSSIEFYQFDVIEGLITIINNLWYALKANHKEFHNFNHIMLELHRLILQLMPLLSPRISVSNFSKLMNILNKTATESIHYLAMSADQLHKVVTCAEKHYGALTSNIESVFENGGHGCSSMQDYCKELHQAGEHSNTILALSSLRTYTISWWFAWNENTNVVRSAEHTPMELEGVALEK